MNILEKLPSHATQLRVEEWLGAACTWAWKGILEGSEFIYIYS
jgi:hypothetical protein